MLFSNVNFIDLTQMSRTTADWVLNQDEDYRRNIVYVRIMFMPEFKFFNLKYHYQIYIFDGL